MTRSIHAVGNTGGILTRALAVGALSVAAACGGDAEPAADTSQANAADSLAAVAAAGDSAAIAAIRQRYPNLRLDADLAAPVPGTAYRAASIPYGSPTDDEDYGTLLAVWVARGGVPVWTHEHRGDFPPHGLVWVDADRDGRTDLFFTGGEETVSESFLFLDRGERSAGSDSAYTLAYQNVRDYVPLLDLDGDGAPELVTPTDSVSSDGGDVPCMESPLPDSIERAATAEYARHVGTFDRANVKYSEENFAAGTMHLIRPIRILQARDGAMRDATRDFPEHLRWRAAQLERYRASADAMCRAYLDGTLRDLRAHGG